MCRRPNRIWRRWSVDQEGRRPWRTNWPRRQSRDPSRDAHGSRRGGGSNRAAGSRTLSADRPRARIQPESTGGPSNTAQRRPNRLPGAAGSFQPSSSEAVPLRHLISRCLLPVQRHCATECYISGADPSGGSACRRVADPSPSGPRQGCGDGPGEVRDCGRIHRVCANTVGCLSGRP